MQEPASPPPPFRDAVRIVRAMVLGTGLAWFAVIDHTPAIDRHRIVPPGRTSCVERWSSAALSN